MPILRLKLSDLATLTDSASEGLEGSAARERGRLAHLHQTLNGP